MNIKPKYHAVVSVLSNIDMSDEVMEKFSVQVEDLMNEFGIFKLDALLNPFDQGVSIDHEQTTNNPLHRKSS